MKKFRVNVAQIICGIGFGIVMIGGCGLDSLDMTKPVVLCLIGLCLMIISAPFMAKERNSEKDDFTYDGSDYSSNYPYDKTFRRR